MLLTNNCMQFKLFQVPKYIANKWEKAPGNIEVGKLKISK
jgi:transcription initiation factor TFIIF subunit beta